MSLAYIDNFFSRATYLIPVEEFQTIGACAIFLASKMEEICLPDVKFFS